MDRSTPPFAVRFRRFVSARSLGTQVRITVTAAVLFQLLLRGIALPEPVTACGTNGRRAPHVHLTGHPHHHHDHRGHGHDRHHDQADHQAVDHHWEHADEHLNDAAHCCDQVAADGDRGSHPLHTDCPADHDADVVYLDASLVIAPPAGRILLPADDVLISWVELPAKACPATGCGCRGSLAPGGPPPDFRGLFPHRLQV